MQNILTIDPLSISSMTLWATLKTQKMTLWAYSQGPKKWAFVCKLKDAKNYPLSVCSRSKNDSMSVLSRTKKNEPLSVCSRTQIITLWAYGQGPKKWPFERTLKDPKNDPLSVRSRTHFRCIFSHDFYAWMTWPNLTWLN